MRYAILALLLVACAPFQDSPFSDTLLRGERELNEINLARIPDIEADGVIRIAVFADPHQNYKDLDLAIDAINRTPDVDFVINLGDFTNSGYNLEYDQFLDSYVHLKKPVLTVIGNHDALGAGPALFQKVFGRANFWFESTSKRFIFFHSANLEDPNGFKPDWLASAVQSSAKPVMIFTHVQLQDKERYFGSTKTKFTAIIQNALTQMVMNGHNHGYDLRLDTGTVMLQTPRTEGERWLLLEIQGTTLTITRKPGGETASETLK